MRPCRSCVGFWRPRLPGLRCREQAGGPRSRAVPARRRQSPVTSRWLASGRCDSSTFSSRADVGSAAVSAPLYARAAGLASCAAGHRGASGAALRGHGPWRAARSAAAAGSLSRRPGPRSCTRRTREPSYVRGRSVAVATLRPSRPTSWSRSCHALRSTLSRTSRATVTASSGADIHRPRRSLGSSRAPGRSRWRRSCGAAPGCSVSATCHGPSGAGTQRVRSHRAGRRRGACASSTTCTRLARRRPRARPRCGGRAPGGSRSRASPRRCDSRMRSTG